MSGPESGQCAGGTEWKFQVGDEVKQADEFGMSVGPVEIDSPEFTVEKRLLEEPGGERYYYVEKAEGENHLYAASAVKPMMCAVDTGAEQ